MSDAVRAAYEEGKGGIQLQAKMHIEDGRWGVSSRDLRAVSCCCSCGLMACRLHASLGPLRARRTPRSRSSGAAGGGKKGKAKRAAGGRDKPLVVITEVPYQTNKVCGVCAGGGCKVWGTIAQVGLPGR